MRLSESENKNLTTSRREESVREQRRLLELLKEHDSEPEAACLKIELAKQYRLQLRLKEIVDLLGPLLSRDLPNDVLWEARQETAESYLVQDTYDVANDLFRQNYEVALADTNEIWEARSTQGLGWVLIQVGHYSSGEYKEAAERFKRAIEIFEKLEDPAGLAHALYGLGRAHAGLAEYGAAVETQERALRILVESGVEEFGQFPNLLLACSFRDHGDFAKARPFFEEALQLSVGCDDDWARIQILNEFGTFQKYIGDISGAKQSWLKGIELAEHYDLPKLAIEMHLKKTVVAEEEQRFKDAYFHQKAALAYGNRVGGIDSNLRSQQVMLRKLMDDLTHMEAELAYLKAGVESSQDGIFVSSRPDDTWNRSEDFLFRFVNAAAASMLGRTQERVLHMMVEVVWPTQSAEMLLKHSEEILHTQKAKEIGPLMLDFPNATDRWYSVKMSPIDKGVAWTVSDITQRVRLEHELVRQRDQLEAANLRLLALDQEKNEMLGIAAHDLRSPIANIFSLCQVVDTSDPTDCSETVAMIRSLSESLLSLIGNLLDINRIERGEFITDIQKIDVGDIISRVVRHFQAKANEKQIEMQVTLEPDLFALADKAFVLQTVENLLSNALKFSTKRSAVQVRGFFEGNSVRIEVADEGPGISKTDQAKLFGKFVRLAAKPTASEPSSGLGLSIVKRLVEAMSGRIGFQSELNQGTLFWVELPRF